MRIQDKQNLKEYIAVAKNATHRLGAGCTVLAENSITKQASEAYIRTSGIAEATYQSLKLIEEWLAIAEESEKENDEKDAE